MHQIQKAWEGIARAVGAVSLFPMGYPAHMRPEATRLSLGSASQGEQRVSSGNYIDTHSTTYKTVQILFAVPTADSTVLTADNDECTVDATEVTAGSVTLEATNNHPTAEPWVVLASIETTGFVSTTDGFVLLENGVTLNHELSPYRWMRVRSTDLGSTGSFQVFVAASS
jgi:hypothetical protein